MSVPKKNSYSAAEIAAMHLPGLPTTKARIIERAASEGWKFEETTGRGGMRRQYEVPQKYLMPDGDRMGQGASSGVVGTIAGGHKADPHQLSLAVRALEEFLETEKLTIDPDRKGALIALLYDYLQRGAGEAELANVLNVVR